MMNIFLWFAVGYSIGQITILILIKLGWMDKIIDWFM